MRLLSVSSDAKSKRHPDTVQPTEEKTGLQVAPRDEFSVGSHKSAMHFREPRKSEFHLCAIVLESFER